MSRLFLGLSMNILKLVFHGGGFHHEHMTLAFWSSNWRVARTYGSPLSIGMLWVGRNPTIIDAGGKHVTDIHATHASQCNAIHRAGGLLIYRNVHDHYLLPRHGMPARLLGTTYAVDNGLRRYFQFLELSI